MSEENVELTRKAIDALNRGDLDAWLAFLSPDVVWEALPGVPGLGELYRGRAEVRDWIEQLFELAEGGIHTEIEQLTDLGDDRVFLAIVLTARGRGSGVPFEMPNWEVIWFAEGLVTRRQIFWTRDEAREAAGLSEQAMSEENVEIVRRANETLQGVDLAPSIRAALAGNTDAIPPEVAAAFFAWRNLFDPEVEIDTSRLDMPGFGVFRGLDGLLDLFGRWIEEWEHYSWIHHNLRDAGEHVILDAEIHATGTSSGVEVVWNLSQTYTFREGKVIRWCVFSNHSEALEAAGLSE